MYDSDYSSDEYNSDDSLWARPTGPTHLDDVPWYRRSPFCTGLIVTQLSVFLGSVVFPPLLLLGFFTTFGVILVCIVALTGPVYYNSRRRDGTLRQWGRANKVAAVIILILMILLVVGYCAMMVHIVINFH